MSHSWLLITFSWLGTVSLQYINTAGPGSETMVDPADASVHYPPLPYTQYLNLPPTRTLEAYESPPYSEGQIDFIQEENRDIPPDLQRQRRTIDREAKTNSIVPKLVEVDRNHGHVHVDDKLNLVSPFNLDEFSGVVADNLTDIMDDKEKKNFSPWGGKRDRPQIEDMWTWKRTLNAREPSMPKRVRFSPWGGKRSGQFVYMPGSKVPRVIYTSNLPELTRIVTNYSPTDEKFNLAGFQIIPMMDKRQPMKIMALSSHVDGGLLRDALPYKAFLENLPRYFKVGHPYTNVALKTDGKRKVKFSAWGGKRSPPIIGPIWTPPPQDIKDATLDAILLIRKGEKKADSSLKLW